LRDAMRGWRRSDRENLMIMRVRIVVHRALRRANLCPSLKGREVGVGRDVVALAGFDHRLSRRFRRQSSNHRLRRGLVLREAPNAPEVGEERRMASGWTDRHTVMPDLLSDLRRVACRDGPRRWRV